MTIASAGGVRTHGVGTRQDLPIPEWLALYGAAAASLISFAALTVRWRRPIRDEPNAGHPLPLGTQAVLDSPVIRRAAQAITLAIALFVTVAAVFGPPFPEENLAPWAVYVTFWVGLVFVSLLFGPVWRVLNPLRLIHALLRPFAGPPLATAERLDGLGYWPAARHWQRSSGSNSSTPTGPSPASSESSWCSTPSRTCSPHCGSVNAGSPAATASRSTPR